ncbi:hypothetical protein [Pseudoflavonifractor phocaeensis]|uniref:hypothetical protein n=1 Tax=Pseudoflavonifractor phocaeensis TaxID=1870988 RepID=UPI003520EC17
MQMTEKKKSSRRWLLPVLLLLAAAAAALLVWLLPSREPERVSGLAYEQNVVVGDLPGKTKEERQAELNSIVEEGMVSISINATPCTAADGSGLVNWNIENPSNQGKLIRVEVSRDDTGALIFATGAMPPGTYLEAKALDVALLPGAYDCTAMFLTYDLETEEPIGKAGAKIVLTVT